MMKRNTIRLFLAAAAAALLLLLKPEAATDHSIRPAQGATPALVRLYVLIAVFSTTRIWAALI